MSPEVNGRVGDASQCYDKEEKYFAHNLFLFWENMVWIIFWWKIKLQKKCNPNEAIFSFKKDMVKDERLKEDYYRWPYQNPWVMNYSDSAIAKYIS